MFDSVSSIEREMKTNFRILLNVLARFFLDAGGPQSCHEKVYGMNFGREQEGILALR